MVIHNTQVDKDRIRAKFIKLLLFNCGIEQKKLAEGICMKESTLAIKMQGKTKFTPDVLIRIADFFDLPKQAKFDLLNGNEVNIIDLYREIER